jgi:hypothetical protein
MGTTDTPPVRVAETLANTDVKREQFIEALRNMGNVRASCQAVGIARKTAYRWRNKWKSFAADWDEALEDACDILEAEAWRRAVKEQSDRLLIFLLKAYRRDKFSEKQELDVTSGGEAIKSNVIVVREYIDDESPD